MANILLIEPDYKNKYPPLGLMKISTYHKNKGDTVVFVKGKKPSFRSMKWDRIYVATLFTFYWKKTIETIQYYVNSVESPEHIYVGGVLATLLHDDLLKEKYLENITITKGLLDKPGILGDDQEIVDLLPPDYTIVDLDLNSSLDYEYPVSNAYIAYSTRGCIRKCSFCAVHKIEPEFKHYVSLTEQIDNIEKITKRQLKDLMIMDNNILASDNFEEIINEIIELGFGAENNVLKYKKNNRTISVRRYVDFNQGVDARLLTEENIKLISKIAIKPLRIAFDHADDEFVKVYTEKVELAAKYGIEHLSNYVLYNFKDTPEDLYKRLLINIKLNESFKERGLKTKIFSFPMRFSPIFGEHSKDRKFIGEHWNWKYIRGVQCILQATHGVVSPNPEFFYRAFGKSAEEFLKIISMPDNLILYRRDSEINGEIERWESTFNNLDEDEKEAYFQDYKSFLRIYEK